MGFLDNIFKNDEKKKKAGSGSSNNNNSNNNPIANIRKNIEKIGQPRFNGAGQSLGGSKPGVVIDISLHEPGPLGIRVEKKSNNDGSAIVSQVVPGSQAERSGLQRGDVLCFSGSGGQNEIPYKMFLDIAQSEQRPIRKYGSFCAWWWSNGMELDGTGWAGRVSWLGSAWRDFNAIRSKGAMGSLPPGAGFYNIARCNDNHSS